MAECVAINVEPMLVCELVLLWHSAGRSFLKPSQGSWNLEQHDKMTLHNLCMYVKYVCILDLCPKKKRCLKVVKDVLLALDCGSNPTHPDILMDRLT